MSLEALLKALLVSRAPSLGLADIAAVVGVALALAAVAAAVQRLLEPPADGSRRFTAVVFLVAALAAAASLVIGDNLALALALIAATSIVRFRVPLSSPTETVVVFWAAVIGMAAGHRFFALAGLATALTAGLAILLSRLRLADQKTRVRFLRVATTQGEDALPEAVSRALGRHFRSVSLVQSWFMAEGRRRVLCFRVSGPESQDTEAALAELRRVAGVEAAQQVPSW